MTVIELNDKIINNQYNKLISAEEGIVENENIDFIIYANMCYNVLNNNTMFDEIIITRINKLIELIDGRIS